MRFVVYGAGAVGGMIGGLIARSGGDVLLIGRTPVVEAIDDRGGLVLVTPPGEEIVPVRAATGLGAADLDDSTVVLLTCGTPAAERCAQELRAVASTDTPVVCFQNGVDSEDTVGRHFDRVYGGVCRIPCSRPAPGRVAFKRAGILIVGAYPRGSDATAETVSECLGRAGFDAYVAGDIRAEKWLKLAFNMTGAMTALFLESDVGAPPLTRIVVGALTELRSVMELEGIRPESVAPGVRTVGEYIARVSAPSTAPTLWEQIRDRARAWRSSVPDVPTTTWQQLTEKNEELELVHYHQPVIDIARRHGVSVPFNQTILDAAVECARSGAGPHAVRASDLLERILERDS